MPLTKGRYPQTNALWALCGQMTNIAQVDSPPRSNLEFGLGDWTDGAMAATGVGAATPVPVDIGQEFTGMVVITGGTAGSTVTHSGVGLYAGTGAAPARIATSGDTGTGPTGAVEFPAAQAVYFPFTTAVIITTTNAPNGFVYASITFTSGSTVPTCLALTTPTAYGVVGIFTASSTPATGVGPLFLSATHGTALAGVMPATIASPSAKAVAPIVYLI